MRAKHSRARPVEIALSLGFVQLQQSLLEAFPFPDILVEQILVRLKQARADLLSRFGPDAPEPDGQHKLAITSFQVDLRSQREIPVFGAAVVPGHLKMLREILPSVGIAHEAN